MKLHDRCHVEGAELPIQIGHRSKRGPEGTYRVSRKWSAQYCLAGGIGTTNEAVVIRKAHEISQRIARGEERAVPKRINLQDLVTQY